MNHHTQISLGAKTIFNIPGTNAICRLLAQELMLYSLALELTLHILVFISPRANIKHISTGANTVY